MRRNLAWVVLGAAVLTTVQAQTSTFQVDRLWPKPLGNSWILGSVTGVAVDRRLVRAGRSHQVPGSLRQHGGEEVCVGRGVR